MYCPYCRHSESRVIDSRTGDDGAAIRRRRACQGRPVTEDQLALLAQQVEDAIRSRGCGEIPSHEVGLAILGPLRDLDEVAYLRFASVYRGFESLADFEDEISALRTERLTSWRPGDEQFLAGQAESGPDTADPGANARPGEHAPAS